MRAAAVALALILSVAPMAAQTPRGTQVIFPVRVNTVPRGDVSMIVSEDNSIVWFAAGEIQRLGVHLPSEPPSADGWVDLRALAPAVSYTVNEETLEIELTVDPALLGSSELEKVDNRPRNVLRASNPSAFLNYALTRASGDMAAAFELGGTRGSHLVQSNLSVNPDGDLMRGLSQYRYSDLARMNEWTVGDRVLGTSLLGGRPVLGGVAVARNFGLDPYFIRTPTLGLEGLAQTPSEVEVYVNGVLVRRERVQPGQIRLDDLPVTAGTGDVRLLVRDAFGREVVQDVPYYLGANQLKKGLWEYQGGVGFLRGDFGELFDYGDPAAYGEARYGFSTDMTLEGRMEGGADVVSGDAGATLRTNIGQFRGIAGGSSLDGEFAPAYAASYTYNSRRYGFGASATRAARGYATLTSPPKESDVTDLSVIASLPVPYVSLTVSLNEHREKGSDRRSIGASATIPLARWGSLSLAAANVRDQFGESQFEGGFNVSWRFGRDTTMSLQTRVAGDQKTVAVSAQKSLQQGPGYGYRVNWSGGDQESSSAAVQYQTNFGRYEVGFDPGDLNRDPLVSASGGLVYIGGQVVPTRSTGEAYALVRVADLEGVTVTRGNQPVGKTGADGTLFIPDLLPYYANNIAVDDTDIPLQYRINSRSILVAPPARGGALVDIPVVRVQSVTGKLLLRSAEEETVPGLGQLRVSITGGLVESPIGRDGSFWLEDVVPGTYPATILFDGEECRFDLTIPVTDDLFTDLGEVRCSP